MPQIRRRISPLAQHLSPRLEDLRVRRGPRPDDGRCVRQGSAGVGWRAGANHGSDGEEREHKWAAGQYFIKNPVDMCKRVHGYIKELNNLIRNKITDNKYYDLKLYHEESWELMLRRWLKLEKDFYNKKVGHTNTV